MEKPYLFNSVNILRPSNIIAKFGFYSNRDKLEPKISMLLSESIVNTSALISLSKLF